VIAFILVGSIVGLILSALLILFAVLYGRSAVSRQVVFDHEWHALERLRLLSGVEFERHVAELYRRLGFQVELTRGSGDQGIDVIAQSSAQRIGIQCKQWSGVVGNDGVQEAIAGRAFYNCSHAAVVCTSSFTASAKELASRANVQLIDGSTYAAMVNRFQPVIQPIGVAAWIPRGRPGIVQAGMLGAAIVIFVLHFSFAGAAGRVQNAARVLARPVATAPAYFAPSAEAPYDSRPAVASRPFSDTVAQYYSDVNNHQYADAYALFSPNFQSTQPYAKWLDGYSDTLFASPRIMPSRDPAAVSLIVTARERTPDGSGIQVTIYSGAVRGIQTNSGAWLIDSGYLNMVRRTRR